MEQYALPTKQQLEWSDCEIGVIIHLDMMSMIPHYNLWEHLDTPPDASYFNPSRLDTDQWLEAAKSLGAKYAVFVAKHTTGFTSWPTTTYGYGVHTSPWKNGKGDIVRSFVESCKKYGIRPGLYASCGSNSHLGLYNYKYVNPAKNTPENYRMYREVVKQQLRELWSNYGELFEIWFDGGCFPGEKEASEITQMLNQLQPNAVVFQGDPAIHSTLRWVGNERGEAPYPCYSRSNLCTTSDGLGERVYAETSHGTINGKYWTPGESDMTNRDILYGYLSGWFWAPGEDHLVYPAEHILKRYMTSVGHNCNLLLGMPINSDGQFSEPDAAAFKKAGQLIKDLYASPIPATMTQFTDERGTVFYDLKPENDTPVNMICLQEDQTFGENVCHFVISGFDGEHYHSLQFAHSIGHKYLLQTPGYQYKSYRLKIQKCLPGTEPHLRSFQLFH